MIVIDAAVTQGDTGDVYSPASPIPDDAVLTVFDGEKWTVYQRGDDIPVNAASNPGA